MLHRALLCLAYLTLAVAARGVGQTVDSFDIQRFGSRYPAINIDSLLRRSATDAGFGALREAFYVAANDIPLDVAAGVYYGGAVQPDALAGGSVGDGGEGSATELAGVPAAEAGRRVQNFSDYTYRHPGCLECHYREHELWLAARDTVQAGTSYARFVTMARAIAFERTGASFAQAWPVTSVRDEYILLSMAGCNPVSRGLIRDDANVPYDVFEASCAGDTPEAPPVPKTIYFDIRIYWSTFAASFGGVTLDRLGKKPKRAKRKRRHKN